MNIRSVCDTKYRAAHDSGPRKPSDLKWVVIHSTEGASAEGAAAWFENEKSTGSANLVVDDEVCYRTVPDLVTPWAAPPLNTSGFHIEVAGFSAWTKADWLNHGGRLHRAAYKTALRCNLYGIPVRQVGRLGLLLGRSGITSHNAISKAFRKSNHTDPGQGFPWDEFISLVEGYTLEVEAL